MNLKGFHNLSPLDFMIICVSSTERVFHNKSLENILQKNFRFEDIYLYKLISLASSDVTCLQKLVIV